MEKTKAISTLLRDADSLASAAVALARACPYMTIESLLAVERAEVVELGWAPSSAHRDCSYLVTMAALLRPISRTYGDMPVERALRLFADSAHDRAGEIAEAVAILSDRA